MRNRTIFGKRVLLTGASRGIGMHLAIQLAAQGANVVLCDGSVHFLPDTIDSVSFRALMTARGGEVVSVTEF